MPYTPIYVHLLRQPLRQVQKFKQSSSHRKMTYDSLTRWPSFYLKHYTPASLATRSIPSGQNCQKNSLKECVFVNLALKIKCHIVKNTLIQTAFSAIFFGDFAHWVH